MMMLLRLLLLCCGISVALGLIVEDMLNRTDVGNSTNVTETLGNDTDATVIGNSTDMTSSSLGNNSTNTTTDADNITITTESPTSALTGAPTITPGLLQIHEINILMVTDMHGWVFGQPHNTTLDADLADVFAFYQLLKKKCHDENKDLILVMNGDFMHGSALGQDPPVSLIPILEHLPWDVVNLGEHDVQANVTVDYLVQPGGVIDWWGPALVTSNLLLTATEQALGNPFRYIKLDKTGKTVLAFGFLWETTNLSPLVTLQSVGSVLKAPRFTSELQKQDFDALLIMTHMDMDDPLLTSILGTVRKFVNATTPIQFVTGHSHQTRFRELDDYAHALEAGKNLESIGFVSFNGNDGSYYSTILDASMDALETGLNVDSIVTTDGNDLREFIQDVTDRLKLNNVIGCAPQDYLVDQPLTEPDSLIQLYRQDVLVHGFLAGRGNESDGFMQSMSNFMFHNSLYKGNVTLNDIISMMPNGGDEPIYKVAHSLTGNKVMRMNGGQMSDSKKMLGGTSPAAIFASESADDPNMQTIGYEIYATESDMYKLHGIGGNVAARHPVTELINNGTTTLRSIWIDYIKWNWPCKGKRPKNPIPPSVRESDNVDSSDSTWSDGKDPWEKERKQDAGSSLSGGAVAGIVIVLLVVAVGVVVWVPRLIRKRRRAKQAGRYLYDDGVYNSDQEDLIHMPDARALDFVRELRTRRLDISEEETVEFT